MLITVSFEAIVNLLSVCAKASAFSLLQIRINPQKEAQSEISLSFVCFESSSTSGQSKGERAKATVPNPTFCKPQFCFMQTQGASVKTPAAFLSTFLSICICIG